ncbi:MAG TPA: DUF3592 domain-containing protein [Spirochaetota bacterium]|nr:DUF3592 domain-containing protein [Spirochaetota bacterium]
MKRSFYFILEGKFGFLAFAILFIITGCVFAFVVPGLIKHAETDSIHTRAQVVSVSERQGMYYTTVEFRTADGNVVKTVSSTASNYKHDAGTEVDISYSKSNPEDVSFTTDLSVMSFEFKIPGLIVLVLGAAVFLLIMVSLLIKRKSPQNENTFFWWINFTGGMTGALVFAIPSMFIYPIFTLFPENIKQQAQNTSILLPIFTIVGILVSIVIFFIARSQYRGRPRWK